MSSGPVARPLDEHPLWRLRGRVRGHASPAVACRWPHGSAPRVGHCEEDRRRGSSRCFHYGQGAFTMKGLQVLLRVVTAVCWTAPCLTFIADVVHALGTHSTWGNRCS